MVFNGSKWNGDAANQAAKRFERVAKRIDRSSGTRERGTRVLSRHRGALYTSSSNGQTGSSIIDPGPDALIIYQVARATGDRPIKLKQEAGSEDIGT